MRHAAPARHIARPRQPAGWRAALLCLLIALLPVRSWAWTSMAVQTAVTAATAAATAAVAEADATPPCHAHAEVASAETPSSDTTHPPHHGCSLCDLCHAGVLPPPMWLWSGTAVPPGSAPGWTPATDTGRQGTDGLFRPPRG
ncbi:hypothetical protein EV672_10758 [Aquabacterium commune]|uniref:DUF2946 family protein n=1 Tax=Aquabacterium commune TaxID=70586 RepID=A0A4V3CVA0_9BURK|nr:hypothetical protein [Aquabacterium commune]TDP81628.1 hypothetical protein EV672_10758 [Aquabacterium commune]